MAQKQYRPISRSAGKIDLQVIPEILCPMNLHRAPERREFLRNGRADVIDCGFVIAGRLDFDQFANGGNYLVPALAEIGKAALGFGSCWFAVVIPRGARNLPLPCAV
jgi:hypothetical protein